MAQPGLNAWRLSRLGRSGWTLGIAITVSGLCAGCGRKATVEDCERIVGRISELELRAANVTGKDLDEEVRAMKESFRDKVMADCVGGRLTDSSLDCMAHAKTSQEVVDECFN